jgi:hypothetical protein
MNCLEPDNRSLQDTSVDYYLIALAKLNDNPLYKRLLVGEMQPDLTSMSGTTDSLQKPKPVPSGRRSSVGSVTALLGGVGKAKKNLLRCTSTSTMRKGAKGVLDSGMSAEDEESREEIAHLEAMIRWNFGNALYACEPENTTATDRLLAVENEFRKAHRLWPQNPDLLSSLAEVVGSNEERVQLCYTLLKLEPGNDYAVGVLYNSNNPLSAFASDPMDISPQMDGHRGVLVESRAASDDFDGVFTL